MPLVNCKLVKNTSSRELLSDIQYGFRFSRSTSDVFTVITECVCQLLDKNGEFPAVALYILKLFDWVWHAGLLHNLKGDGQIFDWIQSFLNPVVKIVLNGHVSSSSYINAGIPQGPTLGITLFLILMSNLPSVISFYLNY